MSIKRIDDILLYTLCITLLIFTPVNARSLKCNTAACERCSWSEDFSMNECCSNPAVQNVCEACDQISETEAELYNCLSTYSHQMYKRRGMIGKRRGFMG
ncbi:unnamed protein product [Heterobilharzia americana]|nr:unnamed protein product [Heterobilharzia americana]